MRAMILAAGRGQRMRPLTDTCPKPLLVVGGQALIVWHLQRLAKAGIHEVLINHAWLGQQIEATLGDGQAWGVRLHYSAETTALETAGGIARALPFFQDQPFLVINGDIWCDWNPAHALGWTGHWTAQTLAQLLLVDNPAHHPEGDFGLLPDGSLVADPSLGTGLTYAGIGLYHPRLFAHTSAHQPAPLAPLLRNAMQQRAVQGLHYMGRWVDVGTPARLAKLDVALQDKTDRAGC